MVVLSQYVAAQSLGDTRRFVALVRIVTLSRVTCQQMTGEDNARLGDELNRPARWIVLLSVGGISLAWGSTFLAYKASLESFPPFTLAAIRFTVGGSVLYAWGSLQGFRRQRPKAMQWRSALAAGFVLFAVGNGAVVWSQQYLTSALGGLLVGTIPVWTALFAVAFFRETLGSAAWAALVVGLFGTGFLVVGSEGIAIENSFVPVIVALIGAAAWSAGSLWIRDKPAHSQPMLSAGMQMLSGGLLLVVLAGLAGEFAHFSDSPMTWSAVAGLFYLAVPNALTFGTFVWLLRVASPILVASYAYLAPLVAVVMGWWILDESLTPSMAIGAGLVLASVAVLARPPRAAVRRSALPPAPMIERRLGP